MREEIKIVRHDETVERELATLAGVIGADLPAYRNHIYRVLTYALDVLGEDRTWRETIAFALVYHDAGLWTARDLAYLEPSEAAAERARLVRAPHLDGRLVRAIIHWHHKITPYRGAHADVVNAVRRADWIDASGGLIRKGLARQRIRAVMRAIPVAGFPAILMRLAADLNHGRQAAGLRRVLRYVYKI
ncbi:phosphohydrolase [Gluconacetobacter asukensis]|uniref:Phosphohydrolase n=1 Tax=Gluconacetobacter asukensis TaxID=1017181 RepID=A0A7W4J3R6_9PROT|nr:phosphohydrolase [Gluconacetobacter asukensis]MBB2173972.1 phosphohydrolase [Gluconacetobacter asukensis]